MSFIFIQENAYENVVWKRAAILSRPQCVNRLYAVCSYTGCLGPQLTISNLQTAGKVVSTQVPCQ